jgi:glycosyltransferase involved in cell wall biosynthesis
MFLVDLFQRRIVSDNELKGKIARQRPYRHWVRENRIYLRGLQAPPEVPAVEPGLLRQKQHAFGYTEEELKMVLSPMASRGQEAVGSMGNDAALAVLSDKSPLLFSYFAYRPEYDLDTFFEVLARLKSAVPGFGCVAVDDRSFPDSSVMSRAHEAIAQKGLEGSVLLVGHVDRDEFLTLLGRSDLFVRTPATDGVCSSVLESLSLGVPVVAAGNACRPETVITYAPGNAGDLFSKLVSAVGRLEELRGTVRAGRVAAEDGAEKLAAIIEERYWPQ